MSDSKIRDFLLVKWKARAAERGLNEPTDLSGACKFAAAFAKGVMGGEIEANEAHTWLKKGSQIIDYTEESQDTKTLSVGDAPASMQPYFDTYGIDVPENIYEPDNQFMRSRDFQDSMRANQPRVDSWIEEWKRLDEQSRKGWLTSIFEEPEPVVLKESAPRTLYHGTLKEYVPEIMRNGLVPTVGDFVSNFYAPNTDDEYYDPERDSLEPLVFAADKREIARCVNAIRHRLQANGIRVTPENIIAHGAIIVVKDTDEEFIQHNDDTNPYHDHPVQVEPKDYYTDREVLPAHILTGNKLKDFLRRSRIDGFWSPRPPIR